MKSKVYKLNIDRSVTDPVDLCKLTDLVKKYVVKKDVYNAEIKNIEDKTPNTTNVTTNTTLNSKINKVQLTHLLLLLLFLK